MSEEIAKASPRPYPRFSLRGLLLFLMIVTLVVSHVWTSIRLRDTTRQLRALRLESGYIAEDDATRIVAVRVPSDEPLTWKMRVRTPPKHSYGLVYSTLWPAKKPAPDWYSVLPLPEGESQVTLRLMEDPRDNRWKIITLVRHKGNTQRVATVLPDRQVELFCGSHDTIRGGIREQTSLDGGKPLRVVDEKWFTGDGGLMLFGSSAPKDDIDGVFAELQSLPQRNSS